MRIFLFFLSTANRGIVRYTIYSGDPDGYFTIDQQNGNIRISDHLDFERNPRFLLNIQASIGHEPQTHGYTQVIKISLFC